MRWIEQALDLGITSFDHADIYGGYPVETAFGQALGAGWDYRVDPGSVEDGYAGNGTPAMSRDPQEVAAVLTDGMDLVVLGLAGRSVSATRARAVVARARQRGCTLLVTGGQWEGASMRMEARVCGYEMTASRAGAPVAGCGRISAVRLSVRARGRP